MKTIIIILAIVATCESLMASSLTTKNGTVYQNVSIISADLDRMMIVHSGGGCQIEYTDLAPDALSSEQRETLEEKLTEHLERKTKAEQIRLARETFVQEQRDKGLIQFEGEWITPEQRKEILALRDLKEKEQIQRQAKLDQKRLELRRQEVELQQQKLALKQKERQLENAQPSYIYAGRYPAQTVIQHHCYSTPYRVPKPCHPKRQPRNGLAISISKNGTSISARSSSRYSYESCGDRSRVYGLMRD